MLSAQVRLVTFIVCVAFVGMPHAALGSGPSECPANGTIRSSDSESVTIELDGSCSPAGEEIQLKRPLGIVLTPGRSLPMRQFCRSSGLSYGGTVLLSGCSWSINFGRLGGCDRNPPAAGEMYHIFFASSDMDSRLVPRDHGDPSEDLACRRIQVSSASEPVGVPGTAWKMKCYAGGCYISFSLAREDFERLGLSSPLRHYASANLGLKMKLVDF